MSQNRKEAAIEGKETRGSKRHTYAACKHFLAAVLFIGGYCGQEAGQNRCFDNDLSGMP